MTHQYCRSLSAVCGKDQWKKFVDNKNLWRTSVYQKQLNPSDKGENYRPLQSLYVDAEAFSPLRNIVCDDRLATPATTRDSKDYQLHNI